MKFIIEHQSKRRIRLKVPGRDMSCFEADVLEFYLSMSDCVTSAKVDDRTCSVTVHHDGNRDKIIDMLKKYETTDRKSVV